MNADRLRHVATLLDEYDKRGEDPPKQLVDEYKRGAAWLKEKHKRQESVRIVDPYAAQMGIR